MYVETFPSRLKSLRTKYALTQQEVADKLKLPQSTIAKYETGKLEPSIETLGKIADFYDISLDWLVGTSGGNNKAPFTHIA